MVARPQTIQIYLPNGNPAGIRMAEITTRTVRVFEVPRPLLNEFLAMNESKQVGVYFLMGIPGTGSSECYIGQSGNVGERLKQHSGGKEFWSRALVAVSLTNSWTNTHIGYMEWQSIKIASEAGRYDLHNGNKASNPHTLAPLEADCHEYLETISVLLTTLGHPVLENSKGAVPESVIKTHRKTKVRHPLDTDAIPDARQERAISTPEVFSFKARGCDAKGYLTPEGVVVLAGSVGNSEHKSFIASGVLKRRTALLQDGIAEVRDNQMVMLSDYLMGSVSTAASVLSGASINGRTAWKNSEGMTYQQVEDRNNS